MFHIFSSEVNARNLFICRSGAQMFLASSLFFFSLFFSLSLSFYFLFFIDRIQERITLKVMIHTLSAFWRQSGLLVIVSQCL